MEEKMNIAVFAGSFDPLTIGHYDIALRASSLFDEVIVLVNSNVSKHSLFFCGSEGAYGSSGFFFYGSYSCGIF